MSWPDPEGPPASAWVVGDWTDEVDAPTDDQCRDFLRMLPLRHEALAWAIEEGDGAAIGRAAADLRRAAEAIGIDALTEVCRRLEARARDGLLLDSSLLAVELEVACTTASDRLAVSSSR